MNDTDLFARPIDGIGAAVSRMERYAEALAAARFEPEVFVAMIASERIVEAEVAAMRVEDEAYDALLDVLA